MDCESNEIQYKFAVYPGNHPEVIREGLIRRGNMREVLHDSPEEYLFPQVNFIWRPVGYPKKSLLILNENKQSKPSSSPIVDAND